MTIKTEHKLKKIAKEQGKIFVDWNEISNCKKKNKPKQENISKFIFYKFDFDDIKGLSKFKGVKR